VIKLTFRSVPKKLGDMNARQYAIKQQEAYNYGRGLFEHQPLGLERGPTTPPATDTNTGGVEETPASLLSAMMDSTPRPSGPWPLHPLQPISEDYTFGSSGGIGSATAAGWAAHGAAPPPAPPPVPPGAVPLGTDLADLTDFTDARLQADLESFLEELVTGMPDADEAAS
jgi:hypothetical protein